MKRPPRNGSLTLAALALLYGCDVGDRRADAGPLVLDAADVHVLGTSDSIAEVEDLAVLEDGSVWVQNSVEPLFVGLDPEGVVIASHGRRGGGPEEFGGPAGFVVDGRAGEAWTFDRPRHVLVLISSPDAARKEVALPRDAIPPGSAMGGMDLMSPLVRTARLGDEVVLPRRAGTGELQATSFWTTIWNADLVAVNSETGGARTVVSLRDALGDLESHFQDLNADFPPFPLWYRLWAVCGNQELRLYDFLRNELRGFASDGSELDPVPLPSPFVEVTPRQFVRAVFDLLAVEHVGAVTAGVGIMSPADSARLIQDATSRLEAAPEQLGAILPGYVDFRCADDGAMWLRPLDLERGGMRGGPTWRRVTSDGTSREVRFPERFDPYRFTAGRAWGVLRDQLDVASVAWVSVAAGEGL